MMIVNPTKKNRLDYASSYVISNDYKKSLMNTRFLSKHLDKLTLDNTNNKYNAKVKDLKKQNKK